MAFLFRVMSGQFDQSLTMCGTYVCMVSHRILKIINRSIIVKLQVTLCTLNSYQIRIYTYMFVTCGQDVFLFLSIQFLCYQGIINVSHSNSRNSEYWARQRERKLLTIKLISHMGKHVANYGLYYRNKKTTLTALISLYPATAVIALPNKAISDYNYWLYGGSQDLTKPLKQVSILFLFA